MILSFVHMISDNRHKLKSITHIHYLQLICISIYGIFREKLSQLNRQKSVFSRFDFFHFINVNIKSYEGNESYNDTNVCLTPTFSGYIFRSYSCIFLYWIISKLGENENYGNHLCSYFERTIIIYLNLNSLVLALSYIFKI